jgi:hypothetical protein
VRISSGESSGGCKSPRKRGSVCPASFVKFNGVGISAAAVPYHAAVIISRRAIILRLSNLPGIINYDKTYIHTFIAFKSHWKSYINHITVSWRLFKIRSCACVINPCMLKCKIKRGRRRNYHVPYVMYHYRVFCISPCITNLKSNSHIFSCNVRNLAH